MIQGKWFAPGEVLTDDLRSVYSAVFGCPCAAADPISWHALILMDNKPVASGRIWWQEGAFWLGDIGVIPSARGLRLGDLALRLLLFKAQSHAAREIRLCCPESVTGFFSRMGFRPDSVSNGNQVEMYLSGDKISLDSCSGCNRQNCPNRK